MAAEEMYRCYLVSGVTACRLVQLSSALRDTVRNENQPRESNLILLSPVRFARLCCLWQSPD